MTQTFELASQASIKLNGNDLPQALISNLAGITVEQHSHLPAVFTIRLYDPGLAILDGGQLDLTGEIEIAAETSQGEKVTLIKGEITALEPEFREGMISELVVRGYDRSHRLYRQTRSRAYLNIKDSDLAQQVAQTAGLQAEVDTTSIVYDHLFQHNQADLTFLMQRAWRIGYECFVEEGKLYFRKPPAPSGSGAASSGAASSGTKDRSVSKLTWGQDLLSFRLRATLAEQVDEVIVRGWDPDRKATIVGRASQGKLYPKVSESKDGAQWAKKFGDGKLTIVDYPVVSQAEADVLAAARLDELSGAFIEAQGVAFRRPDIRAGKYVSLEAVGKRYSGDYLVTSAEHIYSPEGLRTIFSVRGARNGLLSEQALAHSGTDRWPGAVIGIVTNTDDPLKWGRVKVKMPSLTEEAESDWARVVCPGAGPKDGLYIMPAVGDEVLVIFEFGDFSQPYVLGGLWNGINPIPDEAAKAAGGEQAQIRTWRSSKGHHISVYDNADNRIEIISAGGRSITVDDQNRKIVIKTQDVKLTLEDSHLTVESQGDVTVKASANLKLQASGNVDIQAGGQVTVKGSTISLN